jgi:hypothetical protein
MWQHTHTRALAHHTNDTRENTAPRTVDKRAPQSQTHAKTRVDRSARADTTSPFASEVTECQDEQLKKETRDDENTRGAGILLRALLPSRVKKRNATSASLSALEENLEPLGEQHQNLP